MGELLTKWWQRKRGKGEEMLRKTKKKGRAAHGRGGLGASGWPNVAPS